MKINEVVERLSDYIEKFMFPSMVNWQRVTARVFISRVKNNPQLLSKILPVLNIFDYLTEDGNVQIDDLISNLKEAVEEEGFLELPPLFGLSYKFFPSNIDEIASFFKS